MTGPSIATPLVLTLSLAVLPGWADDALDAGERFLAEQEAADRSTEQCSATLEDGWLRSRQGSSLRGDAGGYQLDSWVLQGRTRRSESGRLGRDLALVQLDHESTDESPLGHEVRTRVVREGSRYRVDVTLDGLEFPMDRGFEFEGRLVPLGALDALISAIGRSAPTRERMAFTILVCGADLLGNLAVRRFETIAEESMPFEHRGQTFDASTVRLTSDRGGATCRVDRATGRILLWTSKDGTTSEALDPVEIGVGDPDAVARSFVRSVARGNRTGTRILFSAVDHLIAIAPQVWPEDDPEFARARATALWAENRQTIRDDLEESLFVELLDDEERTAWAGAEAPYPSSLEAREGGRIIVWSAGSTLLLLIRKGDDPWRVGFAGRRNDE